MYKYTRKMQYFTKVHGNLPKTITEMRSFSIDSTCLWSAHFALLVQSLIFVAQQ